MFTYYQNVPQSILMGFMWSWEQIGKLNFYHYISTVH